MYLITSHIVAYLQVGQVSVIWVEQDVHKITWPHGITAWLRFSSMHTMHRLVQQHYKNITSMILWEKICVHYNSLDIIVVVIDNVRRRVICCISFLVSRVRAFFVVNSAFLLTRGHRLCSGGEKYVILHSVQIPDSQDLRKHFSQLTETFRAGVSPRPNLHSPIEFDRIDYNFVKAVEPAVLIPIP